ncbi:M15 family metallopeptidase [Anaerofustis butyriciformans]|uniref:M15 family metallopeptidase n=1 Tax=Anaerofustis butyriciformans TaxID=3108533 RepID=UPI002E330493|nr:M15 family metallopeptidase [Anaerofustis sp. HA2171]
MNKKKRKSLKDIFNGKKRDTLKNKSRSLSSASFRYEQSNSNKRRKVCVRKRNDGLSRQLKRIKKQVKYNIGTFLQRIAGRENISSNKDTRHISKNPNAVRRPVKRVEPYERRSSYGSYRTSTVDTRRRIARRRRRTIVKLKRIFFIAFVFIAVFLFSFIVYYKPFKTTVVGDVTLRGDVTYKTQIIGVDTKTIKTGTNYAFNVKNVIEDHFNNKVIDNVDKSLITINVTSENLKNNVSVNKNVINIDDSVTSGSVLNMVVSYKKLSKSYSYIVKDNLSEEIDKNMIITNPNEYDAVVNKQRHLSSSYKPSDLVKPNIDFMQSNESVMYLRKEAAKALEELCKAAQSSGYKFYGVSGFRSYSLQVDVYKDNIAQYGNEEDANFYSAKPGESEHQLGLSMDVSTKEVNYQLVESLGDTPAGKWLEENCYKYGFIIRFPENKEKITGYSYEPWHIRYVGKDLAKIIHDNNLTLEEYFESDKY